MSIRVLLDARKLGGGGIGVYLENLIDSFVNFREEHGEALTLTLLVHPVDTLDAEIRQKVELWSRFFKIIEDPAKLYSLDEYFRMGFRLRSFLKEQDLFHSPHYTLPFFLGVPAIVTIHDVIHITNPERRRHKVIGSRLIKSSLRRAAHVITVSDCSRQRIGQVAGLVSTPVSVIPNALRQGFGKSADEEIEAAREAYSLASKFCLFVGTDRPHKGFRELLHAWAELKRFCQDDSRALPKLAVVGGRFSIETQREVEQLGLARSVKFLGEVSVSSLRALYSAASLTIVPSRVEGFGLVALEAMACGTPLLCSNIESLREVCGDIAWYSPNHDKSSICESIVRALDNKEEARRRALQGIERAREFSGDFVARKTLSVYHNVIGKTPQLEYSEHQPTEPERASASGNQ